MVRHKKRKEKKKETPQRKNRCQQKKTQKHPQSLPKHPIPPHLRGGGGRACPRRPGCRFIPRPAGGCGARSLNTLHVSHQVQRFLVFVRVRVKNRGCTPKSQKRHRTRGRGKQPPVLSPVRTAVPFWGQTTWNLSGLSPNRDCASKRVNPAVGTPILEGHTIL